MYDPTKIYLHKFETVSEFQEEYNGPNYHEPWVAAVTETGKASYNKIPYVTGITFNNLTWVNDIPASGGTATKNNCTYTVSAVYNNGSQINITSAATVTGSLVVAESSATTRHSAGTLTLTATYSGFSTNRSVTVYQTAAVGITAITLNNIIWHTDVPASGGTASKDNLDYTVTGSYNTGGTADITSLAEVTGSLVVPPSTIEEEHTAGTMTLTASYCGLTGSQDVIVYQAAFVPSITAITLDNLTWVTNIPWFGGVANSGNCSFSVTGYYDNNTTTDITSVAEISGSLTVQPTVETILHSAGTLTLTASYSGCTDSDSTTVWQEGQTAPYSERYLTFEVLTGGTIIWKATNSSVSKTISYSKDSGSTWTDITSSTGGTEINVNAGDTVMLKGDNVAYGKSSVMYNTFSGSTAVFNVEGNIMSLVDSTGYTSATTLTSAYTFYYLFNYCTGLTSAENLVLPATTLADYCYDGMFYLCSGLTSAPMLPATTLADFCYGYMFRGCKSLATVPLNYLTATELTLGCYRGMFSDCTSLTTAPELPATTLAEKCYHQMFNGCRSLTTTPNLPATTLAKECYMEMFSSCSGLISAPITIGTSAATMPTSACTYMFAWCGSLTTAPTLPAITLSDNCYSRMFIDCSGLTTAPELPATTVRSNCYAGMFDGCTSLTTGPSILPATVLSDTCYAYMFYECENLTIAPELPATTLIHSCYERMFQWCTKLNYIKCLATDISASNCTSDWVQGVSSVGTFVKDRNMTGWTTGNSGIHAGWTVENYPPVHDYSQDYLTFKVLSAGTITWKASDSNTPTKTISYSKDSGSTWTNITSSTGGASFNVNAGDTVLFKGDNTSYASSSATRYTTFSGSTAVFNVEGNIMSLIDSTGFTSATTLESAYTFCYLFNHCTGLTSVENLVLPATTLTTGCYYNIFSNCTSLTTAPELPATTLASHCYYLMFYNCTSLTTAPELPATTLANGCYLQMFQNCTSLTTAPELSATTLINECYKSMFKNCTSLTSAPELPAAALADSCYYHMFEGCTNLNYIKCLATDISASACTDNWVSGVSATGTFVKLYSMSGWTSGENGIPTNWTVEDIHDYSQDYLTLEATSNGTIVWKATNGTYKKTISYSKNGGSWTSITSSTAGASISVVAGDKVRFKGTNSVYATIDYYNIFSGTARFDAYGNIMSLIGGDDFASLDAIGDFAFNNLFNSSKIVYADNLILPAKALGKRCYSGMFSYCELLKTAPTLPATTLAQGCYYYMFSNCSSLSYIKCLATDISATSSRTSWVKSVSPSGTFVKDPNMTEWTTGENGIPTNWTVEDAT